MWLLPLCGMYLEVASQSDLVSTMAAKGQAICNVDVDCVAILWLTACSCQRGLPCFPLALRLVTWMSIQSFHLNENIASGRNNKMN